MNLHLRILALVALVGCGGASSTSSADPSSPSSGGENATATSTDPQPFLWEVRSGDAVSYLFGTIHVGFDLESALPARHRHALESAREVAIEADVSSVDPQASVRASLLPPERTLDAILPEDVYRAIATRLGAEVPEMALKHLRPWIVNVLYTLARIREERPEAPATAMDAAIGASATERGATMLYLETVELQLAFINEVPEQFFVDSLTDIVREPEVSERQTHGMLDAYARGDAEAMEAILFEPASVREFPEAYEILFHRRNRAWTQTLEPKLREGGVFVAVGLGHLLGEAGLVAMLEARGFVVTRLR